MSVTFQTYLNALFDKEGTGFSLRAFSKQQGPPNCQKTYSFVFRALFLWLFSHLGQVPLVFLFPFEIHLRYIFKNGSIYGKILNITCLIHEYGKDYRNVLEWLKFEKLYTRGLGYLNWPPGESFREVKGAQDINSTFLKGDCLPLLFVCAILVFQVPSLFSDFTNVY